MTTSAAYANPHADIGTELVREWVPDGDRRAVIVLVHGVGEHSRRYERTGMLLAEAGFAVRCFDLIGHGGSGGRRADIDDWSRYHDQVGTHVEWARSGHEPVVLFGHSLGGAIALGYVLSDRTSPDLLVLSSPFLDAGTAVQKALVPFLGRLVPTMRIPQAIPPTVLSRDPSVGEEYFNDPLVIPKPTLRWGMHASHELDELNRRVHELDIPTLVIHGGDDRLVPTVSSEVFETIDGVERKVYNGLRHECMNEPEGPEVVADIVEWIQQKL